MFFTVDDVVRLSRTFRSMPCEVSEEMRGWSWSEPPLLYPYDFLLSASDLGSGFCETGRYVYMKYVAREREVPGWRLRRGSLIHAVLSEVSRVAKSLILQGVLDVEDFRGRFVEAGECILGRFRSEFSDLRWVDELFRLLWMRAADAYSSGLARARARSPYMTADGLAFMTVPFITEFPVDGSLVGLSRTLRIDVLLHPNIVAEVKTRGWHPDYELGVASYALAIESQYEVPVNYGIVLLVKVDAKSKDLKVYERVVRLSDRVRQRFIDVRDSYARIVEESMDPGRPRSCSPDCPFIKACREG